MYLKNILGTKSNLSLLKALYECQPMPTYLKIKWARRVYFTLQLLARLDWLCKRCQIGEMNLNKCL